MKKIAVIILFLVLAIISIKIKPASVSASSDGSDIYKLETIDGVDLPLLVLMGVKNYVNTTEDSLIVTLNTDGTAIISREGNEESFLWYTVGDVISIYSDKEVISGTLKDGFLSITIDGKEMGLGKTSSQNQGSQAEIDGVGDVYKIVSVMGFDISWIGYDEDSMVITIYPNGTALIVTDEDESGVMRYERYGDKITFYAEGEEISGTLNSNKLTLLYEGAEIMLEKKYTAAPDSDPDFEIDSEGVLWKYRGNESVVTIPDNVTSIGDEAFFGNKNLKTVNIPDSVTSIGADAFNQCSKLISVNIPDSVTHISSFAFSECYNLTSIHIPDNLKSIGSNPFAECDVLSDFEISWDHPVFIVINGALINKTEKTLVSYPQGLSAESYIIPKEIKSIGNYAFYECSSLTSVTFPDSMQSIGKSAFYGCSGLASVTIPDSVAYIGEKAFGSCSQLVLEVERNTAASKYAIDNRIEYVYPGSSDTDYEYKVLTNKNAEITGYTGTEREITIPSAIDGFMITSIGSRAFRGNDKLTAVTISDNVTSIGEEAFANCTNLTTVILPKSITSISERTFAQCSSLTSITIPEGVSSIRRSAFSSCSNLSSVTLPESLTSIERDAFWGCSELTTVPILNRHVVIEEDAFNYKTYIQYLEIKKVKPADPDILLSADVAVNDVITFGHYEQDNNLNNGPEPIEWQVLSVENDRVLVISKYGLDINIYHSNPLTAMGTKVTWENSKLRKWLDTVFYNNAFDQSEKANILEVKNQNPGNQEYNIKSGKDTIDAVFLLSIDEAGKYFTSDEARQCQATDYVRQNTPMESSLFSSTEYPLIKYDPNGCASWWLRSLGGAKFYGSTQGAAAVSSNGSIDTYGFVYGDYAIVRPAVWLYKKGSGTVDSFERPPQITITPEDLKTDAEYQIDGLGSVIFTDYPAYDEYFNGEGYLCKAYDGKEGADEFGIILTIRNTTGTDKQYLKNVTVRAISNDHYMINGYWQQVSENFDACILEKNITEIPGGSQGNYWFGAKVPDFIVNGPGPLRLEITIDDVKIAYQIRGGVSIYPTGNSQSEVSDQEEDITPNQSDSEGGSGLTSFISEYENQISSATESSPIQTPDTRPDSAAIPEAVINHGDQKDDIADTSKNTSADPLYLDFLSYLKNFVRSGEKEPIEPYKSLGCYLYDSFNFNTDNPGFLFWDIDGDGKEELLIGDEKYNELRDVYTITDNRIIDILHGEYKKTIMLNTDSTFTVHYLISAFSSNTEIYIYRNGELHLTTDNTPHTAAEIRFSPLKTDPSIPEFHETEHPKPTEEPIIEMPVNNEPEKPEEKWTAPVKTVWSTGNTVRQKGTMLSPEDFGIVLSVKGQTGGWFLFQAPEDGDYVFSVRAPYLSRSSFRMRFYNENNEFDSTVFNRSAEVQSYVLEGIKAGQIVYWWDDDNTGRAYTLLDPFELMISIRSNRTEMPGNNNESLTYFGTYKLKNISGFTPEAAAAAFSMSLEQLPNAITVKLQPDGTGSLSFFGENYSFTYELNGTDLMIRSTDQNSPFEYRGQKGTGNITLDMDGLVIELVMTGPVSAENEMSSDGGPAFDNTKAEPVKKAMPAVGDIMTFGHYEQDNDPGNGPEPIEWKVLGYASNSELGIRSNDTVMLLLSTKVLDAMAFNTGGTNSWEDSSLRRWLQNSFYYEAFSNSERGALETVSHKVKAQDPYPDKDTVFILSLEEIQKYLPYPSDRQIEASSYAISRKVFLGNNGLACWWTRSYLSKGIAYNIWSNGEMEHGDKVTVNDGGILPAVYLNINTWMNLQ